MHLNFSTRPVPIVMIFALLNTESIRNMSPNISWNSQIFEINLPFFVWHLTGSCQNGKKITGSLKWNIHFWPRVTQWRWSVLKITFLLRLLLLDIFWNQSCLHNMNPWKPWKTFIILDEAGRKPWLSLEKALINLDKSMIKPWWSLIKTLIKL